MIKQWYLGRQVAKTRSKTRESNGCRTDFRGGSASSILTCLLKTGGREERKLVNLLSKILREAVHARPTEERI